MAKKASPDDLNLIEIVEPKPPVELRRGGREKEIELSGAGFVENEVYYAAVILTKYNGNIVRTVVEKLTIIEYNYVASNSVIVIAKAEDDLENFYLDQKLEIAAKRKDDDGEFEISVGTLIVRR